MNIAIVGSGYVGLVTGACFAEIGVNVTCVDVDWNKIEKLKQGEIPIYEPGLKELVQKNQKAGRLDFTTSLESVLDKVQVIFSAVGTPPDEDGSADLKYVLQVARTIGRYMTDYRVPFPSVRRRKYATPFRKSWTNGDSTSLSMWPPIRNS